MRVDLGEYYAAALVKMAKEDDGLSVPRETLRGLLIPYTGLPVTTEDVSSAVRILNRCDISYTEDDEFAGQYIVITNKKFEQFLQRVADERSEYDSIVKGAPDENMGISRAEEAYLPYLASFHKYGVLRKYSAFGDQWLSKAIEGIEGRVKDGSLGIPASDRIVSFDDNNPDVVKIKEAANGLKQSLEEGNDLGDMSAEQVEAVTSEVQGLRETFANGKARVKELARRAKQTLRWIAEKAGGTIVGQLATTLYKLLMNFLGIGI